MLDSLCSPSFFFSPFSALPMMSLLLFFFFFPNSLLLPLCATHHRTPMRLHVFIPFSSSIKTALVIRKIGAALRPLSSLAIKPPLDFFPCVCVSNSDCRCDCCNNNDDDDQSDRSLVFYFYPAFFFSQRTKVNGYCIPRSADTAQKLSLLFKLPSFTDCKTNDNRGIVFFCSLPAGL